MGIKDFSDSIITRNAGMLELKENVRSISISDIPVLFTGESGTGKELFAGFVHQLSNRRDRQMISLNCLAIPDSLIESELYGHTSGAFTGARQESVGLVQQAHKGSLFLDEIGDMSMDMQIKLLRVIEDGKVRKLGSRQETRVDFRLISATNSDLQVKIDEGIFRSDLFYRINGAEFLIPPLRERKEDIPVLVRHFNKLYSKRNKTATLSFSDQIMEVFCRYNWPGNVRELKNEINRLMSICTDNAVRISQLNQRIISYKPAEKRGNADLKHHMQEKEKSLIMKALIETNFNKNKAAERLGISRRGLYKKLEKLNFEE